MFKHSLLSLIFLSHILLSFAQNELQLVNSKKIDPNRYSEYDGDPYLFTEWLIADITKNNLEVIKEVFINYNGHTESFEIKNGDRFIELYDKDYLKIEITRSKNGDALPDYAGDLLLFRRDVHDQYKNTFVRLIYESKEIKVIESFKAVVVEKTFQDVGRTVVKRRLLGVRKHYLLENGELKPITLKRSSLIKAFGGKNKKGMDSFMKKQKIDLKKDEDIKKFFAFYETFENS